jgi:hypothetical protein
LIQWTINHNIIPEHQVLPWMTLRGTLQTFKYFISRNTSIIKERSNKTKRRKRNNVQSDNQTLSASSEEEEEDEDNDNSYQDPDEPNIIWKMIPYQSYDLYPISEYHIGTAIGQGGNEEILVFTQQAFDFSWYGLVATATWFLCSKHWNIHMDMDITLHWK